MRAVNIVQDMIRQEKVMTNSSKGLSFRPGQIFSGKVLKLFPNQIAEVQIGSQKVIAQLEVGLSVNDRHLFQVQSSEGQVRLKVLEQPNGKGKQPLVENLLKQLNLPATKEHVSLLQFFLKEQLPITKEVMHNAAEWLKSSPSFQEGLQSIHLLLSKQLPFTKDVFLSMSSVMKNESVSVLMDNLKAELLRSHSTETANRLENLLSEMTVTEREKFNTTAMTKIVKEWLGSADPVQAKTAFSLLQNLGFLSTDANEEEMMSKIVEKWINAEGTKAAQLSSPSIASILSEIIDKNGAGKREEVILSLAKLQFHLKNSSASMGSKVANEIQQILSGIRENNLAVPLSEKTIQLITKPIVNLILSDSNLSDTQNSAIMKQVLSFLNQSEQAFSQIAKIFSMDTVKVAVGFSKEEQALLTRIKAEVQLTGMQWENPDVVKDQMKHLIRSMGFSYEHDALNSIKNQEVGVEQKIETLKPLLMQLLSEEQPSAMREAAEKLLHKITGLQVLSQDIGPIQQYVLQIPLSFWEMKSDLTMQWSGRKTEKGTIDPNFCRVLFYLNLNYINETIVDLQVQNRVMNISIINEKNDLRLLAEPFLFNLKERLAKINYQLSSITFEKPVDNKVNNDQMTTVSSYMRPSNFNGVDFRI
ncbi:hypothetical protein ACFYKT_02390 [Cytobacillus sp. FJAT-53684]|uniref:Flagellar hook-length control protein-like C-terminal domain-containing protein n=1 Tax=Cytobacillus mangrovibacter TaxID=3299024 RepID=A0ABW6JTL1_9BACI